MIKGEQAIIFNYKDKAVFESIFKEWISNLILFSRKITSDEFISEDIVLTSFTKVWEGNEEFQSKEHLRSYIYSSVRNSSLNYLRKEKHLSLAEEIDEQDIDVEVLANESFIESHVRTMLFNALEELPDKSREVFKLNVLEGITLKEISKELDISENTVKTHKTRALKMLRDKLSPKLYSLFVALYKSSE